MYWAAGNEGQTGWSAQPPLAHIHYTHVKYRTPVTLEREVGDTLAATRCVDEDLGHEQPDGNSDRYLDHTNAQLETAGIPLCGARVVLRDKASTITNRRLHT